MNKSLLTALTGFGIAQLLKIPWKFAQTGDWDLSELVRPGGMPSSHSAGVASLATYLALRNGVTSSEFALGAIFGLIVMYDAMGVRLEAGEIAKEVNALDVQVEKLAGLHPGQYHLRRDKQLRERIGHLPVEVLGGSLLGILIGWISHKLD